jgi:hypothetical protein
MSEAKINALVKTRDGLRMAADAIDDYLETLAPPGMKKATCGNAATPEPVFTCLTFEPHRGERLGDYETAQAKNNRQEQFDQAFNILKTADASIQNRFHGPNYAHSYWLYNLMIYRQKLKN